MLHGWKVEGSPDAEDVLLALPRRFYTVSQLARVIGGDRMIQWVGPSGGRKLRDDEFISPLGA